jgi:ribosomal-protein-alanine N-acetyltransferase
MAISLRTPRLLLREWRDEDAEAFAAMSADPALTEFLLPPDDDWVARVRRHWEEHGFGQFVVELPSERRFIGVVGLSRVRWAVRFAPAIEVAWRLAPPHWGHGYALEAARAAVEDGFYRLGLDEIVAFTVAGNRRSRKVMGRLGMGRDPEEDFDHPAFDGAGDHPLRRHVSHPAMSGAIFLVRHGETEWNLARRYQGWGDSPLTPRGIAQAEAIGRRLRALPEAEGATLVASPLGRARRTAEIIQAARVDLAPIEFDERLKEI